MEYQVRNRLHQEEIEKLQRGSLPVQKTWGPTPALQSSQPSASALLPPTKPDWFIIGDTRWSTWERQTCRVLAYSYGDAVDLPASFTALAPGFGVRQFNVMDLKVGSFIPC